MFTFVVGSLAGFVNMFGWIVCFVVYVLYIKRKDKKSPFCVVEWLRWFCWLFMAALIGWFKLICLILLGLQGLADLVRFHLVWLVCLVAGYVWFGGMLAWVLIGWVFFGWLCCLFLFLLFCLTGKVLLFCWFGLDNLPRGACPCCSLDQSRS